MASISNYGSGPWYARLCRSFDGSTQYQWCETEEEAKEMADHWRETATENVAITVGHEDDL